MKYTRENNISSPVDNGVIIKLYKLAVILAIGFLFSGCTAVETEKPMLRSLSACTSTVCTNGYRWKYIGGQKVCRAC